MSLEEEEEVSDEEEVVVCLFGEYLLWRCLGVVFSVDVLALGCRPSKVL